MRILLIHPQDSPFDRGGSTARWDLVVDLGWAGREQYQLWQERLGCPVRGLYSFADWKQDVRSIHQAFAIGNGCLDDADGIDWWALLTPTRYPSVYEFLLLEKIAREIGKPVELYVTRPHSQADALAKLAGVKPVPLSVNKQSDFTARLSRHRASLRTLTPKQILRIALDKWDTDYTLRRFFARRGSGSDSAHHILLPSAYRNASRAMLAYAALLPEREFLLVTTRTDGRIEKRPPNVDCSPLAAYAPVERSEATEREIKSLTERWLRLREKLHKSAEPLLIHAAGLFPDFGLSLRKGLRIRDAWRAVFERENIDAVLCGDENNPYTRLPLLLAQRRGLPAVYCSHGALDATILIRGVGADVYLVKGEMEKDYLVAQCGVPEGRAVIGAPTKPQSPPNRSTPAGAPTGIYFFSEPYELYSGRTELLYSELLANLCQLARQHSRKVIVKLHPFESRKARSRLVDRVLLAPDRSLVEVSAEPMSEELLRQVWFAVTVESSSAIECALAGIPSFLCGWFDLDLYAYARQYEKFGAALMLNSPADLLRIPDLLTSWPRPDAADLLHHPITPAALSTVLQDGLCRRAKLS